jgi:hypothetical protein
MVCVYETLARSDICTWHNMSPSWTNHASDSVRVTLETRPDVRLRLVADGVVKGPCIWVLGRSRGERDDKRMHASRGSSSHHNRRLFPAFAHLTTALSDCLLRFRSQ